MTDEELDEIESRVALATEGPWSATLLYDVTDRTCIEEAGFGHFGETTVPIEKAGLEYAQRQYIAPDSGEQKQIHADAEFIAHARQDIPALLAEVDRLKNVLRFIDQLDTTQERWWPTCLQSVRHALANGPTK